MKNIKPQVIISAISIFILAAIGGILFIINSNDHKECATSVYYYTNSKGEKVKKKNISVRKGLIYNKKNST